MPCAALYEELSRTFPLAAARVIPLATVHRALALQEFLDAFPGPVLTKPFGVRRVAEVLEVVIAAGASS